MTAESSWVREHQNVFLIGPYGNREGLPRAGPWEKACGDGYTALFAKAT